MSIPKKISYCWFGGNPLPEKVQTCIKSWREKCPDYEIIQWNESNYDIKKNKYMSDAFKEKKWAFVSDYARLDIIYNFGGIYLDTDVELIKGLDDLLDEHCFLGIDKEDYCVNTGLGFGAEPQMDIIKNLRDIYNDVSFYNNDGTLNLKACTKYTTEYLEKYGYERKDETQNICDTKILNSEYFCPLNYETNKLSITQNTVGIHWYEASWFNKSDKHLHKMDALLKRHLPSSIAKLLSKIYRYIYRFIEYSSKGILVDKIKNKRKRRKK